MGTRKSMDVIGALDAIYLFMDLFIYALVRKKEKLH